MHFVKDQHLIKNKILLLQIFLSVNVPKIIDGCRQSCGNNKKKSF